MKRRFNGLNPSKAATNPERPNVKGKSHMRDRATIRRLNMYRSKPKRSADGREELSEAKSNPYKVVLNKKKLPWSLLNEGKQAKRPDILTVEPFQQTFGKGALRKKPRLTSYDYSALVSKAAVQQGEYDGEADSNLDSNLDRYAPSDPLFNKGQSKRIWGELYKVIDSSDVVVQVLDARDPNGTRSKHIESHLRKNHPQKHLIFVMNKCDLVPTYATSKWVTYLSEIAPTLAFHAHLTKPFGKGSLITLVPSYSSFFLSARLCGCVFHLLLCAASSVRPVAPREEADQRGIHRISQRGKVLRDQHCQGQEAYIPPTHNAASAAAGGPPVGLAPVAQAPIQAPREPQPSERGAALLAGFRGALQITKDSGNARSAKVATDALKRLNVLEQKLVGASPQIEDALESFSSAFLSRNLDGMNAAYSHIQSNLFRELGSSVMLALKKIIDSVKFQ